MADDLMIRSSTVANSSPAEVGEKFADPDQRDMWRMGKVQELKASRQPGIRRALMRRLTVSSQRTFGPWALIGFASILGCAWQYVLITVIWSLPNGGPAGAVYMFLACCVGLLLSTVSLAKMASIAVSRRLLRMVKGGRVASRC